MKKQSTGLLFYAIMVMKKIEVNNVLRKFIKSFFKLRESEYA